MIAQICRGPFVEVSGQNKPRVDPFILELRPNSVLRHQTSQDVDDVAAYMLEFDVWIKGL